MRPLRSVCSRKPVLTTTARHKSRTGIRSSGSAYRLSTASRESLQSLRYPILSHKFVLDLYFRSEYLGDNRT